MNLFRILHCSRWFTAVLLLPATEAAVVVSNFTAPIHTSATADANVTLAQSFVAGSDATLAAVSLNLSLNPPSAGLALALHADASGVPATPVLATLSAGAGESRFEALSLPSLTAGATYWIVATATAPKVDWNGTSSGAETGDPGWTIGDTHREKAFSPSWILVSDSLQMSLEIVAVPEPACGLAVGAAILGWAAAWRRQVGRQES